VATNELVAVAYDGPASAERALEVVRVLAEEHALVIHDAAIALKRDDGSVELRQSRELAVGEGIVSGGAIGLLLGLAVAVPVVGAVVGLAGGAGFAALDKGISNDRMRELGATLAPGHALLFALVSDADWGLLRDRLAPYGGEIVTSEVDDEVIAIFGAPTST
jgi:uncharacterized membrane protein